MLLAWETFKIFLFTGMSNIKLPNRFPMKMVEEVCPIPGAGQNHPLPLLLPFTFRLWMISSMMDLPMEKLQKLFLWLYLQHKSFLCPLMLWLGLNPCRQTQDHCANIVLVRRWKILESLVTDITGMKPLSISCALSPTLIPFSNNNKYLTNLPLPP